MPDALKLTTSNPPPAPMGVAWIDVATAAGRMNLSERQVRNLCGDRWMAIGLARVVTKGRRSVWIIREDADPALARIKFADQMECDDRQLTDGQRKVRDHRMRILQGWDKCVRDGFKLGENRTTATKRYLRELPEEDRVTESTLYDWESRKRRGGPEALVDGRSKSDRSRIPQNDPFLEEVKHYWLKKVKHTLASCIKFATQHAAEQGWTVRSDYACRQAVRAIPEPTVNLYRHGKEAYTNESQSYIQRIYDLDSNAVWVGDHHTFDVWVNADAGRLVRPWLTAWCDARSRKLVGYVIIAHDPNQQSILEAFRRGAMEHGLPQEIYIDNGRDYASFALHGETKKERRQRRRIGEFDQKRVDGVFARLEVKALHCWPYHGQSKPIERFFRTVEDQFCKTFATYCGNKPESRPDDLAGKLKRGKAPMLSEFIEAFDAWLTTDYHARPHSGDGMNGMSPNAAFAAHLHTKRTAEASTLDAAMLPRTKPVKVTQNGVRYQTVGYGATSPELIAWHGKNVVLAVDGRDLSNIQVWTEDGTFICLVQPNRRISFRATHQDLAAALKEKAKHSKLQKEYHRARPRMADDTTDLMLRAAAARNAARAPEPPAPAPNILPLRTPIEDQMPALQRAIEAERPLRKAAGAESMSFNDMADAIGSRNPEPPSPPDTFSTLVDLYRGKDLDDTEEAYTPFTYNPPAGSPSCGPEESP